MASISQPKVNAASSVDENAFRQLVDRHLTMVFSVARRMLSDTRLVEEAAQNTFVLLAQKAGSISEKQSVGGWLYQTARHEALHIIRAETRRQKREEAAAQMQAIANEENPAPVLKELESAMGELPEPDRNLLVLRFLEERTLVSVGAEFAISEDAARMRVNRALEKLRHLLERKGVIVSAGVLGTALLGQAHAALPAGLKENVVSAALASAGAVTSTLTVGGAKTLISLNAKFVGGFVGVALLVGIAIGFLDYDVPLQKKPLDHFSDVQRREIRVAGANYDVLQIKINRHRRIRILCAHAAVESNEVQRRRIAILQAGPRV